MERLTVALEAKGRELDSADANLKEANKKLRRVCMELNVCAGVGKEVATEKQAETGCTKARRG
jgi:hypothetical protein